VTGSMPTRPRAAGGRRLPADRRRWQR
jgi:hypothetical protein